MSNLLYFGVKANAPDTVRDFNLVRSGAGDLRMLRQMVDAIGQSWIADAAPQFIYVSCTVLGDQRTRVIKLLKAIRECGFRATHTRLRITDRLSAPRSHFGVNRNASMVNNNWSDIDLFIDLCC